MFIRDVSLHPMSQRQKTRNVPLPVLCLPSPLHRPTPHSSSPSLPLPTLVNRSPSAHPGCSAMCNGHGAFQTMFSNCTFRDVSLERIFRVAATSSSPQKRRFVSWKWSSLSSRLATSSSFSGAGHAFQREPLSEGLTSTAKRKLSPRSWPLFE